MSARDYLELTKPRLTGLVGLTVVAGSCLTGGAGDLRNCAYGRLDCSLGRPGRTGAKR